ncbi:MAG: hypothetical protein LUG60_01375 [Erysipelotrichaceae bacterium]|nr:hypothetical protein [Erysipelotrichaceae bacterium]
MIYKTISLYDLMKQNVDKKYIMQILLNFTCPLNPDVENFVHNKAFEFERVGLSRTYLVYAQMSYGETYLVAIFSLGQSSVELSSSLTRKDKKMIFGTTYPIGKNIKTLLIGQLSKNYTNGYNQYINGNTLMNLVFSKIKDVHSIFPSVVTHIDCKDDIHLRKYYEKFGFRLFKEADGDLIYLLPSNKIYDAVTEKQTLYSPIDEYSIMIHLS